MENTIVTDPRTHTIPRGTEIIIMYGYIFPEQIRPPNRVIILKEYKHHYLARAIYEQDDGTTSYFMFCINKMSILCGDIKIQPSKPSNTQHP